MKNFHIPMAQLTPTLISAINDTENKGIYVVYGVYIYKDTLNISRVHKGNLQDIILEKVDEENYSYLVPVPEYVADEQLSDYAKYLQIHFVSEEDIKTDDEMMQEFVQAFAEKLADADEEDK